MLFRSKSLRESVYDPESNEFIAHFADGGFETNDEKVCERLTALGYESVPESKPEDPAPEVKTDAVVPEKPSKKEKKERPK